MQAVRVRFGTVNAPEIFELLKRVRWSSFHAWTWLHNFLAPLSAAIGEAVRRWIKRRKARRAQSWPSVEGRVGATDVAAGTRFFGSPRHVSAIFKYSYSIKEGSETSYYSGEFSRLFPDDDRAWEWLWTLKNKRIRVHFNPERPQDSVVLVRDLDSHFPLPVRTPEDLVFPRPEIYNQ
jgi:hypothetical protein